MFSQGLSSLKKAASTDTRFTWRRTDSGCATTSQPKTIAVPESGVSSVPRIRMSVDLPLPLGPRMPVTPPASTVRSSSWRATLSFHSRRHQGAPVSRSRRRNALRIPWISIAVVDISSPSHFQLHHPLPAGPALRTGPTSPRGAEARRGQAKQKRTVRCPTTARSLSVLVCCLDSYLNGLNVRSEGRLRPRWRRSPSRCRPLVPHSSSNLDTPERVYELA